MRSLIPNARVITKYNTHVPSSGTMEWKSLDDGVQHKASVTIPAVEFPFRGILWLKIMPDNSVVAVTLTEKEYVEGKEP